MAKGIGRSLVIGLAANTKNFGKDLKKAESDLTKFKNGVKKIGMAVTAGFAAMGAAALAFGKDAVQAAMEDQQEQIKLRRVIHANIKTHKDMAVAVEKSVTAMQKQYGVSDNKLRKGFARLILATKNVNKSQKLMRLAMDVSAGTGKDLETVVTALSKAYLGNNTSLGRLGVGLSKAELKGMSFQKVTEKLATTFKGQGAAAADTFQGKMNKLNERWGEFKENIGYKLMPILMKVMDYIEKKVMPNIESFAGVFTGDKGLNQAMKDGTDGAYKFGQQVKGAIGWIIKHKDGLIKFAEAMAGIWAVSKVVAGAKVVIGTISTVSKAFIGLRNAAAAATAAEQAALGGGVIGAAKKLGGRAITAALGAGGAFAATVGVGAYAGYKMNEAAQTPKNVVRAGLLSRSQSLRMLPQTAARKAEIAKLDKAATAVFNISGALDPKETARQIQKILQQYGLNTGTVQTTGRATP